MVKINYMGGDLILSINLVSLQIVAIIPSKYMCLNLSQMNILPKLPVAKEIVVLSLIEVVCALWVTTFKRENRHKKMRTKK